MLRWVCDAIEYFLDGERKVACYGADGRAAQLPIRQRNGSVAFYQWGALADHYQALDNTPGWAAKFPRTAWMPLEEIRAHKWATLEPKPVCVMAARFARVGYGLEDKQRSVALNASEFIQGMLARIGWRSCVYVVTVPPPAEFADWQNWPRIVGRGAHGADTVG